MTERLDGQPSDFDNAGTSRPHGRAQRHQDRVSGVDRMAQMGKIPTPRKRPKIRRHRAGPATKGVAKLPPVPPQ